MADKTQQLLKPTMVVASPNEQVAVKDVYENEGVLKPVNTYVEKSKVINKAEDYIAPKPQPTEEQMYEMGKKARNASPEELKELFKQGYNPHADLKQQHLSARQKLEAKRRAPVTPATLNKIKAAPNAKDAKKRVGKVVSGGWGGIDGLTGSMQTTLLGDMLIKEAKSIDLHDLYSDAVNSKDKFDKMSMEDYAKVVAEKVDGVTGTNMSESLVQLDGVNKLITCDPLDLDSMQDILGSMTGTENFLGIVDVSAVTSTMSTVLKFANDWGLPGLVKQGLKAVKDKELKLKMLKNATLTASLRGDISLTKYYARELDEEANSMMGDIADGHKYALFTISHQVCINLLTRYKICNEDQDKDYSTLGNELIEFLDSLDRNWVGTHNADPFIFNDFNRASKDALKVLLRTKYSAAAAVVPYCKPLSANAVIQKTFPQLLIW